MAKLKVMCARSMHLAAAALGQDFARAGGHEVEFEFGTVGALQAKLDAGASADVLILSRPMIDKLEAAGRLAPGSRADVARTFIAVCVAKGAPLPDIATPEAFKRTLQQAHAVAMSDPAVGGSAAVYVPVVFERLGLAATMKPKSLLQQNGVEVARRVVEGKADLGLTLSGELASVEGAAIAGPLPPPYGQDTILLRGRERGQRGPGRGHSLGQGAHGSNGGGDLEEGGVRAARGLTVARGYKSLTARPRDPPTHKASAGELSVRRSISEGGKRGPSVPSQAR